MTRKPVVTETKKSRARRPSPSVAARKKAARSSAPRASGAPARVSARPAKRPRESAAARRARAARLLTALRAAYPEATTALHHRNAFELLVATILSAQCTDERVNRVTPDLFRRYPDAEAFARADATDLEAAIRSTGFYHNKTKNLIGAARALVGDHAGRVPDTMPDLLRLPGVARKTANCVLGTWYHKNEGVVVDTHVGRVAERLGLTPSAKNSKDAERIERDLMELFPPDTWTWLAHALIDHGRRICTARKPKCGECPLAADCPSAFKV